MAVIPCPRCRTPHDGVPTEGGLLVCAVCDHRWPITTASMDQIRTEAVADRRNSGRAPVIRPLTEEYLPDEPPTTATRGRPLTERREPGSPTPPSATTSSSRQRRAIQIASDPIKREKETSSLIDSGLFDQLEADAQRQRARLATIPEITLPGTEPGTDFPTTDRTGQRDCPVCGHRFASPGTSHHQCPQCGTGWDGSSGRLLVAVSASDPLIGRTLGGCLIDRKLGEGGMGAVYLARQLSLDRSIAIKILPADLARNRNFIQRFEREAKSLARINHPNILHIYDFAEDPQLGLYFMLIEYVEGMDLGEIINRRGVLGQVEVLDMLRQALMGLEAAAEKGVIHRDIKPDNLMVGNGGVVKVSDFGLAKGMISQTGVTAAGVRVGTPAFMSPEQCDGVEVDVRSDIYNLGATAFLCLTGRLPYDAETPFAIMLKHKTAPVPSLCDIDPTLDRGVERLIQRMLAKRPDDRCTSMRDLIEQVERLEVLLAGTGSILRKSRGPFRALLSHEPPPPRTTAEPQDDAQDWQQLVEQFRSNAAIPAQIPTVSAEPTLPPLPAAPPPARSSGRIRAAMDPTPAAPASRGSSASRRLDAELSQARDRGRRQEWERLILDGDRHARSGRHEAAVHAFEAAATQVDDEALRAELIIKAGDAQRRQSSRRRVHRWLLVLAGAGALLGSTWAVTPSVHGLLAERDLAEALLLPAAERPQALAACSARHQPYPWYVTTFRRSYIVPAADRALALALAEPTPSGPSTSPEALESQRILSLSQDAQVPWVQVQRAAQAHRSSDALLGEVLRRATGELTAQEADFRTLTNAWTAGDHARALELASAYRTRHPRADANVLDALPVPGRVTVSAAGAALPADLRLRVDGVEVPLTPQTQPGAEPQAEALVCRRGDRPVAIEVQAAGFRAAIDTLAGGPTADPLLLTLRAQPRWAIPGPEAAPGALLLAAGPGHLLVDRRSSLWRLDADEGRIHARLERTPGQPSGLAGVFTAGPQGRWLAGLDDGSLAQLSPDLVVEHILHRGRAPLLAFAEGELTYRPGRRLRLTIEDSLPRQIVAWDSSREWWRYPDPRKTPLKTALVPYLQRHEDQVVLVDDGALHLIDEDGGAARVFALPAHRSGPVLTRTGADGRPTLLVPTIAGLVHLALGTRAQPVRSLSEPVLGTLATPHVALTGDTIVAASGTTLLRTDLGAGLPRWRVTLPQEPTWGPARGDDLVVVADVRGTLMVVNAEDGVLRRRIVHGTPLAATPLILEAQILVLDRTGTLSAYDR